MQGKTPNILLLIILTQGLTVLSRLLLYSVAQAGLKRMNLLLQLPTKLGLQAWPTSSSTNIFFFKVTDQIVSDVFCSCMSGADANTL